jgi:hypothetical protein
MAQINAPLAVADSVAVLAFAAPQLSGEVCDGR